VTKTYRTHEFFKTNFLERIYVEIKRLLLLYYMLHVFQSLIMTDCYSEDIAGRRQF